MPGALVLLISYLGCHIEPILVVWFLAITLITAAYAGAMANVVDIAPNFAGPVLAFAQTIHMTASFLSPLAAGYILSDQVRSTLKIYKSLCYRPTFSKVTISAWRTVFNVTAAVAISTYAVYQIFGTAEVQTWNSCESALNQKEQEELITQKENGVNIVESTKKNGDNIVA